MEISVRHTTRINDVLTEIITYPIMQALCFRMVP